MKVRIFRAALHYEPSIRVFTALSGPVDALDAIYVVLERAGFRGAGEVRANIAFLSEIEPARIPALLAALIGDLDLAAAPETMLDALPALASRHAPMIRQVVEAALLDGIGRRDGVAVATLLGGAFAPSHPSNQCLFAGTTLEAMLRSAKRYADDGFGEIKLRVGVENAAGDLERLARLRAAVGEKVVIAIDANGSWSVDEAAARLRDYERFAIAYCEQPTRPGDWDAFAALARRTSVALMADEALRKAADYEALMRIGAPHLAHLKLVKSGSLRGMAAMARRLADAGIRCMVGQMNEGGLATAAAAQVAMAVRPALAELYGAYGLIDDPASGVSYAGGAVRIAGAQGLGVEFDERKATLVWSSE